jgi:hypothetical protein
MNLSLTLHIVLWTWLILAIAALGFCVFLISTLFDDNDAPVHASFLVAFNAAIAFCFSSFMLLGHAWTALWLWRIAGLIAFGLAIVVLFFDLIRKKPEPTSPPPPNKPAPKLWHPIALIAAVAATAVLTSASFFVKQAQTIPPATLPLTVRPIPTLPVNFGPILALTLLAVATIIFALLFIREIRQSGPPSFETFSTGLGGDASGWQVSPSLTFLVVTILLASFSLTLATRMLPSTNTQDKQTSAEPTLSQAPGTKPKAESAPTTKLSESGLNGKSTQ